MAYNINLTNGTLKVTIADGTTDLSSTSLSLVGKNFPGYGEYVNENFVWLLENFSNSSSPTAPVTGQLWYDSSTSVMKVYNGSTWVAAGSSVELDQSTAALNYLTMVGSTIGAAALKTNGTKGLTIQPSTGYIGINSTQVPSARLMINASSTTSRSLPASVYAGTVAQIYGNDSDYAIVGIDAYGTTVHTGGFWLRKARGTSASPTAVQSNDFLGAIAAGGYAQTGFTSTPRAGLFFLANENWTNTANGTKIHFNVTPNGANAWVHAATIDSNSDLVCGGDVVAYGLSDQRVKENIVTIDHALEKVASLDGITFNWKDESGKKTDKRESGVIAQQIQEVLPEAVAVRNDGNLGVRYEKIIPLLIEAIKDLQKEIVTLKTKLA